MQPTHVLAAPPALGPALVRGALRSPRKSRGLAGAGSPAMPVGGLPRLVLPGVRIDLARLAAYERVCGFPTGEDAVPLTYPHVLGFPLAMRIMSGRAFPLPLLGLVHTSIEITRRRRLPATGEYEITVYVDGLTPHRRGTEATVVTEVRDGNEEEGGFGVGVGVAWESRSTYLARHGRGDGAGRTAGTGPRPTRATGSERRTGADGSEGPRGDRGRGTRDHVDDGGSGRTGGDGKARTGGNEGARTGGNEGARTGGTGWARADAGGSSRSGGTGRTEADTSGPDRTDGTEQASTGVGGAACAGETERAHGDVSGAARAEEAERAPMFPERAPGDASRPARAEEAEQAPGHVSGVGRVPDGTGAGREGGPEGETVLPGVVEWRLGGDVGRRYGAVSGDRNPIHLHPLGARLFGFPRAIAHGMWTVARCLAEHGTPPTTLVRAEFRAPVSLPGTVTYASDGQTWGGFELRGGDAPGQGGRQARPRVHVSGRVYPLVV